MVFQFSKNLIEETIQCFKEEDNLTITPEQANETIMGIRQVIKQIYGSEVSDSLRILYGGSVNTKNVDSLLATSDIDGALVGGASLDPQSYLTLVKAALNKAK